MKYTRLRYELKIHRFVNSSGIDDLEVVYEHLATLKHQEDKWIKLLPKEQIEFWRPKVITGKRQPYIYTQEQMNCLRYLFLKMVVEVTSEVFP